MATIKKRMRPEEWNSISQTQAPAEHLWLLVDLYDDGAVEVPLVVQFADYAGLEAEWDAGVATSVLEAAVEDLLGLTGGEASSGTRDDPSEYSMGSPG